ncbi:MAG: Histidine triad (HIT) protein [uncultured bacterium]|nr:MAG: Histidine triad (HIT) protein [uncultured bacterium]
MDCIFCKMANHELAVDFLYETEQCFVIRDIQPKAKVHLLAIPKVHLVSFNDITADNSSSLAEIGLAIKTVVRKLEIADSGYRIIINNGEHGGQEVQHLHFHILGGERLGKMV